MAYNFCQTNQDSTVSNAILYVYGFTLPLVVIAIVEFIGRSVLPKIGLLKIGGCQVPAILEPKL